jgi:hypothetical protein
METFSRGTLDPWFVTGFVEGEGTFTFSRNGRNMALYFAIKLNSEDRGLLEEIQRFFEGAGKIYRVKARAPNASSRSGWTKEASYYRVTRLDDLAIIAQHFGQYPLRGSKAQSFRIWLEMLHAKQRFRRPQIERLESLASELSDRAIRNRPCDGAEAGNAPGAGEPAAEEERDA